ncbi:MAG: hypothetical protein Q7U47_15935 [Paludibacter sp.]|nr:hypothetical protein [Paludibacter sp.]
MRTIIITIFFAFVSIHTKSQSLIKIINDTYSNLDSITYTEQVIKKIKEDIFTYEYHKLSNKPEKSISDVELLDAITKNHNRNVHEISDSKILFVLNFEIDTSKISTNDYFRVNPHYFKFNLFCFDKKKYPFKYVLFYDGELDSYSTFPTFSRKYLKHVQHAFKVVLRRKPQYLLFCWSLPNSVVYVLNNKIYVYRVIQRKTYEMDEYLKLFSHTIRKVY